MTTLETVLLSVLTGLLSILFLLGIAAIIIVIKLLGELKKIILKAEDAIDSVESAAELIRDNTGKVTMVKLIRNIIKLANKR